MGQTFAPVARRPVPVATVFDSHEPADHALGRSVGGFGTKIHIVSDGNGVPLNVTITPGQTHESTQFEAVLAPIAIWRPRTGRWRGRPRRVAGDRGYHAHRIRAWLHDRGMQVVIPPRRTRAKRAKRGRPMTYNPVWYRGRNVVERSIGWLKEWRSVATRFDKLAVNYLQTVKLAVLMRYLRILTV
jgi:transposase